MNKSQPRLQIVMLAACLLVMAVICLLASSGTFPINLFDGSLMLLQPLYAGQGLVPYHDYGFIYSPGIALFFGQTLGITDAGVFLRLAWLTVFAIMCGNAYIIVRLLDRSWGYLAAGMIVLLSLQPLLALFYSHGSEPFTLPLMLSLMLLTPYVMRHPSRRNRLCLGIVAMLITFVRWDRALVLGCTELMAALCLRIFTRQLMLNNLMDSRAEQQQSFRLFLAGAAMCAGALAALALMFLYGFATGTASDLWLFLFDIPARLIPTRQLPLSEFISIMDENSLWYFSAAALVVMIAASFIASLSKRKEGQEKLSGFVNEIGFLCAPLSVIPYALGRADYAHFIPLAFLVIAAIGMFGFLTQKTYLRILCAMLVVIIFLPLVDKLTPVYQTLFYNDDVFAFDKKVFQENLKSITGDCARFIPDNTRTLFVGRDTYQHFMVNPIALYLARPDIRPATPFITEDPGIQNTCDMGDKVADDLRHAAKPMLAFLASDYQWPEPNATRFMTSCGRMEKALQSMPSHTIGDCMVGSHRMRVAVYY